MESHLATRGFHYRLRSIFLLMAIVAVVAWLGRIGLLLPVVVFGVVVTICLFLFLLVVGYCFVSMCLMHSVAKGMMYAWQESKTLTLDFAGTSRQFLDLRRRV